MIAYMSLWVGKFGQNQWKLRVTTMDMEKIPVFKLLKEHMSYLTERQRVIAANVANSDTPGYESRDLAKFSFQTILNANRTGLTLARTEGAHLEGIRRDPLEHKAQAAKKPFEVVPTGNAVNLQEEMLKLTETQMAYAQTVNLYKKNTMLMRLAFTGR